MKKLLFALCAISLYSCAPKIRSVVSNDQPALPDTAFVLVLDQGERFDRKDVIGTISSSEEDCTYHEIIPRLKQQARSRGANLIKITEYSHDNCDKITAKIYKVDNVKAYETKFEWSKDRKLTWDDYKGNAVLKRESVAATTSCRLGLRIDPQKIYVTNEFICHQSSVKPTERTPALLAHEQLHFDLCEVYARMLRKELANTNTVPKEAFIRLHKLYIDRQQLYDDETNHGLDPQAQAKWADAIPRELSALSGYVR
jgi:hypothetical protein